VDVIVLWDLPDDPDGTVVHIAEHGVSQEEVEEVLGDPSNPTVPSSSSGNPITFGETSTDRYIAVVWEEAWDEPRTIKPITAYETQRPRPKRKRKRS
jgi:hypothetical protein